MINPFGKLEYLYRDIIYDKKLVFLQHGVTKDNQSKWLNKYNRNLFGFIVSTKPEYDSAFTYDYFIRKKISGLRECHVMTVWSMMNASM